MFIGSKCIIIIQPHLSIILCYIHMFMYINKELKTLNTKGPRIKHVCRSAESVLGQTLATFGNILDKTEDVNNESKLYFNHTY